MAQPPEDRPPAPETQPEGTETYPTGVFKRAGSAISASAGNIAVVFVAGALLIALTAVVVIPFKWPHLAEEAHARGLITVSFTLGTVLIALAIVGGSLLGLTPANTPAFEGAKWVLTTLLGIFGTVVGFYFGSAKDEPPLLVAPPAFSRSAEGELLLQSFVSGGRPPYRYSVECEGVEPFDDAAGAVPDDGWVRVTIPRPEGEAGDPICEVTITDAENRTGSNSNEHVEPREGATAEEAPPTPAVTAAPPPAVSPVPGGT